MQAIRDLAVLLAQMQPRHQPGRYAFVALPEGFVLALGDVVASMHEPEGISVIVSEEVASNLGLPIAFLAAWITLEVHSDLAAVGLTAAFATAMAQAGIGCNVVAGTRHDHLFVPVDDVERAMDVLHALSKRTAQGVLPQER